jgi:TetR/AcrR family transcriptional regulator, transcriptional repressor for nem operon
MARTVNEEEFATKRSEILDAAQRVVLTKGYQQMAIRDVLDALQISSGAFHHYFSSRGALLEALTQRIEVESEKPLLPILHDPHLTAIEKLQGFFGTLDRLRMAQKASIIELAHVWYTDDNAIVRQKVDEAVFKQRAPLVAEIVRQGIREGVFTTTYPDRAGEVILSLLQGMGNTHAKLFLSLEQAQDERRWVEEVVTVHAAYMEAIERVLDAPPNCLSRTDAKAVAVWVAALRGNAQA